MSILDKLTEGIVGRDLRKEGDALLNKWEKTGLLEGIGNDVSRQGMARLLENQAAQLLKEASTMSGGAAEGFASVAFPLVRRVFGGLLANDIVSVQPMSLPSGLIFFLDFTFNSARGGAAAGESLYGGGVVAAGLTGGVDLTIPYGEKSFYGLNNGYSSPTGSLTAGTGSAIVVASGYTTDGGKPGSYHSFVTNWNKDRVLGFDPDIQSGSSFAVISVPWALFTATQFSQDNLITISGTVEAETAGDVRQIRRLTRKNLTSDADYISDGRGTDTLLFSFVSDAGSGNTIEGPHNVSGGVQQNVVHNFAISDNFVQGSGQPGSVLGTVTWGLENESNIPEIDIKVDSVAVTAVTKKLKAKWTPELGQDLNAYHNLDAEVELTSILSEQIALEIDREILQDLVKGSTAGTYYWARSPGMFLNRTTGVEVGASSAAPDFTGTVSEWYETLVETINDVSAAIHRKTLRGGANFIVVSPEVANILEFTSGFRASVTLEDAKGTVGAVKSGSISKKWDVYVDPYFPRNLVLVGRKGGSFLESGYVYAPYVPLQVTPTIFGVDDFVPRKGVMTRYAKQMVRPDMYGLVIVRGMVGESGATS
jgi:hypothetical protein